MPHEQHSYFLDCDDVFILLIDPYAILQCTDSYPEWPTRHKRHGILYKCHYTTMNVAAAHNAAPDCVLVEALTHRSYTTAHHHKDITRMNNIALK